MLGRGQRHGPIIFREINIDSGPPPESCFGLYYLPEINRFVDEDGHVMHDLEDLFPTWELEEWKRTKRYDIKMAKTGELVELYYVNDALFERTIMQCMH